MCMGRFDRLVPICWKVEASWLALVNIQNLSGALAQFSPVMRSIKEFAASGKYVFGICNGFQILCESGLLPGALIRNRSLHFVCKHVNLRLENPNTPFTSEIDPHKVLSMPIAHAEGNYTCDDKTFHQLEENGQIVFPDADLEAAADAAVFGGFFNAGECCNAGSRLILHKSIASDVVKRVAESDVLEGLTGARDEDTTLESRAPVVTIRLAATSARGVRTPCQGRTGSASPRRLATNAGKRSVAPAGSVVSNAYW